MKTSTPLLFDKLSISSLQKNERDALLRDVELLLNNASRSGYLHLEKYLYCQHSVLNYGLPSLSRQLPINVDALMLAQHIQNILMNFEPRIDPRSIRVMPVVEKIQSQVLAVLFDIYGQCIIPGYQVPLHLRIALDYSSGAVTLL